MRELAFGDIEGLGGGRVAVQDVVAMRMAAECGDDLVDVPGLIDQLGVKPALLDVMAA